MKNKAPQKPSLAFCIRRAVTQRKKECLWLLICNLALIAVAVVFPIYCDYMWNGEGQSLSGCDMIEYLKLYCPACGGTRSLYELMHFNFVAALKYSPFCVFASFLVAYLDVRAVVSLLKNEQRILHLNVTLAFITVGVLLGTFLLRNALLVLFGVDPIGDLADFWGKYHLIR